MDRHMSITLETARALEQAGIVKFRGASGLLTTAEIAFKAPMLCQMHSNRGDVFNLTTASLRLVAIKA